MSSPPPSPKSSKKILDSDVSSSPLETGAPRNSGSSDFTGDGPVYRGVGSVGISHRGVQIANPNLSHFDSLNAFGNDTNLGGIGDLSLTDLQCKPKDSEFRVPERKPKESEFRVPEGKNRHVGGSRQLPPDPPKAQHGYGEIKKSSGARVGGKPMNLPGVEGTSLSATCFQNNCRVLLPPLPISLIVTTIKKCLSNAKCDYEYLEKKAKWKAVTGIECSFLNFVCQLYNAPKGQEGFIFEIARREGDSVIFQKVWRSIREGLEAMSAKEDFKPEQLKVSPILDAPPPLSPALMESAPKVDNESLQPLCLMVEGRVIEQQLYAAQCTAKMVSSSTETRRVVGNSSLIKKLTTAANHINMSEPLPLEHAILRHVTYTLAIVSEELLCKENLAKSGAMELCFRVVLGVNPTEGAMKFEAGINPNIMDLDSRREAARALTNMCSFDGGYDDILKANLPDENGLNKWCKFVDTLKDTKLRAQCKRVIEKVRSVLPQKVAFNNGHPSDDFGWTGSGPGQQWD